MLLRALVRRFLLTGRILRRARTVRPGGDLREVARPHLESLRDRTDETEHLGCLEGAQVVYVDKLESRRRVRLRSTIGASAAPHRTSLGTAILARLAPGAAAGVLRRLPLDPDARRTLARELAVVQARGCACDHEGNERDVSCVGAPIVLAGHVRGAVSVSGATGSVRPRLDELGAAVRETARAIEGAARCSEAFCPLE